MFTEQRLTAVLENAPTIPFTDQSRIVLLSDCHRGTNSRADDFSHNRLITLHALQHYYNAGYTYIEVGDGDELWENRKFSQIRRTHRDLYQLMSDFHMDRRFYMLFGNHNRAWQNPKTVKQQLTTYQDEATLEDVALFPGITVYEALILHHQESNHQLFITHGHQGDLLSDVLWPVSRFFVRVVWRTCQILGRRDPTSPAQNYRKRQRVEHRLIAWVIRHQRALICGHTHRPTFPQADAPPYYNTGSCVHPYAITGLEIVDSTLRLIKWEMRSDPDGVMRIVRETLGGPRPIEDL